MAPTPEAGHPARPHELASRSSSQGTSGAPFPHSDEDAPPPPLTLHRPVPSSSSLASDAPPSLKLRQGVSLVGASPAPPKPQHPLRVGRVELLAPQKSALAADKAPAWERVEGQATLGARLLGVGLGAPYRLLLHDAEGAEAGGAAAGPPLGRRRRARLPPPPRRRRRPALRVALRPRRSREPPPKQPAGGAALVRIGGDGVSVDAFSFEAPALAEAELRLGWPDAPRTPICRDPLVLRLDSRRPSDFASSSSDPASYSRKRAAPTFLPTTPSRSQRRVDGEDQDPSDRLADAFGSLIIAAHAFEGAAGPEFDDPLPPDPADTPPTLSPPLAVASSGHPTPGSPRGPASPPNRGEPHLYIFSHFPNLVNDVELEPLSSILEMAEEGTSKGPRDVFTEAKALLNSIDDPGAPGPAGALPPLAPATAEPSDVAEPVSRIVWVHDAVPPYLLSSDAERMRLVAHVESARAEAESDGPVTLSPGAEPEGGLGALAKALANPYLLDTPLFASRGGRELFLRHMYALVRLARTPALALSVVQFLFDELTRATIKYTSVRDVVAHVNHCATFCYSFGVEEMMVTTDLLLIAPKMYHQLSEAALATAALRRDEAAEGYVEALYLRACVAFVEHRLEDAAAPLFEAWSVLIRASRTPCRQEARLVRFLASIHLFAGKLDLADHFLSRTYWFSEEDDDIMLEVDATQSHLVKASLEKRGAEMLRLSVRSIELASRLRTPLPRVMLRLIVSKCYSLVRLRRFTAAFRVFKEALEHAKAHDLLAYADFDGVNYSRIWWWRGATLAPSAMLSLVKAWTFVTRVADPKCTTPQQAHLLWAYGDILLRVGRHKNAAAALAQSLQEYAKFEHMFPPNCPRLQRVRDALRRALAGLEAGPLVYQPAS
eukprot:tig00000204_g17692.t1